FDEKGRRIAERVPTTDDLAEGAAHLYYTDERARVVVDAGIEAHVEQENPHPQYALSADLGTAAGADVGDFATAEQGDLADSALQPGANISDLTNDAGYVDAAGAADAAPLQSIVAGANVSVDTTDPRNPVISAAGGGAGAVSTVNGVGPDAGGNVQLSAANVGADPAGSAAAALAAANSHADAGLAGKGGLASSNAWTGNNEFRGNVLSSSTSSVAYVLYRTNAEVNCSMEYRTTGQSVFTGVGAAGVFTVGSAANLSAANFSYLRAGPTFISPGPDNTQTAGLANARYTQIYAVTGSINTSDAREKTTPRHMTDVETAAAVELAGLPCIFQWLHAIAEKGEDDARLHAGPTVQAVIAVMQAHGLDPYRYGFVCYDAWDEQHEIREEWPDEYDDEGNL
ncbi:tail fiber domain-containing protein, partial [Coralloluteibacterium thermophilus]